MSADAVSRGAASKPREIRISKKNLEKVSPLRAKQQAKKIPLLDLTRKYKQIAGELHREWDLVFSSMRLLNGPNLAAFEEKFAQYCGTKFAFGVASGTDAIYLSLQALGIGRGDEVILPAHAPAPVLEPVIAVGATPVLVDKAVGDYGPDLKSLKTAIGSNTKAILAVHLLGLACDMDRINEIARSGNIPVIEDSSQAQGALYKGRRAAGLGTITPMSLGPVKNLASYGDGGIVLTDDEELAERIKLFRVHGQGRKYDHRIHGWNSRLDELQAVVLRIKLPTLDRDNARRGAIAARYTKAFAGLPLKTPPLFPDRTHVFHQYVLETPDRDSLRKFLESRGIGTGIYYPSPLHQHQAWKEKNLPTYLLPEAERYCRENFAIPVFAELKDDEVEYIISAVHEYYAVQS